MSYMFKRHYGEMPVQIDTAMNMRRNFIGVKIALGRVPEKVAILDDSEVDDLITALLYYRMEAQRIRVENAIRGT